MLGGDQSSKLITGTTSRQATMLKENRIKPPRAKDDVKKGQSRRKGPSAKATAFSTPKAISESGSDVKKGSVNADTSPNRHARAKRGAQAR